MHYSLVPIIEKADVWSHASGTLKEILSHDLLKLLVSYKVENQEKTLKLGNQLLGFERHYTPREMNKILGILHNTYRNLDAHNEITKLIPLLEKYQDLDQGWRAKGFTHSYDIGMINYKVENYELAAKHFFKQLKVFDSIGNQLYVSSMYNNIGLCYYSTNNNTKAISYFQKALTELEKPNKIDVPKEPNTYKKYFEMVIKGNIATIDFDNGSYEKALSVFKEQRKHSINIGEFPIKSSVLLNLSKTHLALNQAVLANQYADSAIASINRHINPKLRIDIYNNKGKTLLINRMPKKSIAYFEKATKINDSIKQLKIARDNLVEKVKYEIQKKEEDLHKAQQTVLLKEKIASQQAFVIWVTVILFLIISYLYYKSRKNKNIIEAQQKVLQASVKEKEILLKEVHHRVKNNLQVISGLLQLQSTKIKNNDTLLLLEETQNHISSIATIHEMLYNQEDSASIYIADYLKKLTLELIDTYDKFDVKITVNAENISLSINKAIPIGLIVNELITNSFKYAFDTEKGSILIDITKNNDTEYVFTYSDNGKGLPPGYQQNLANTMGFRLIDMLAEEMNGTMKLINENGIKITIQFSGT